PMIAIVAGIGLLLAYPLHGERLEGIQQRAMLMRHRAAAELDHFTAAAEASPAASSE
ncbi:MAG: hypothetical protein GX573_18020, partial [Chloroflexi bacterium]|nr:hypothetical protein [Chloroflexota bacterium]